MHCTLSEVQTRAVNLRALVKPVTYVGTAGFGAATTPAAESRREEAAGSDSHSSRSLGASAHRTSSWSAAISDEKPSSASPLHMRKPIGQQRTDADHGDADLWMGI